MHSEDSSAGVSDRATESCAPGRPRAVLDADGLANPTALIVEQAARLLGVKTLAIKIKAPDLSALQDAAELGGVGLSRQTAQIGAQGMFLAANVLGLQTGGDSDCMANGIDKIERNARKMWDVESLAFV